jgi:predicted alpha/beta superfamily hydrolase
MYKLYQGVPHAPVVVLNAENDTDELCALLDHQVSLLVFSDFDWFEDLSPWKMAPLFKGQNFGGHGKAYLRKIEKEINEALNELDEPGELMIAGYSLAGLFALYAMYESDLFTGVIACSASTWFEGFVDFTRKTPIKSPVHTLYLSLGDKEKNGRNKTMATVEENTLTLYNEYKPKIEETVFQYEKGGHFKDENGRLARGILWAVQRRHI